MRRIRGIRVFWSGDNVGFGCGLVCFRLAFNVSSLKDLVCDTINVFGVD